MKSILIIDTPKDCTDCQLMADGWCYGKPYTDVYGELEKEKRPSWCPLRPLPQKKNIDKTLAFGGYENIIQESLVRGYNACLEEITK